MINNMVCLFFAFFMVAFEWSFAAVSIVKQEIISSNLDHFDCHSSSLVEVSPGVLMVVWKGGPGNGKSNIDIKKNVGIWGSRYENGSWSAPEQIVSMPNSVCWTPVLTRTPTGELLLFYRAGQDPRNCAGFIARSLDSGRTWKKSEMLPAGVLGPTKSKPVYDKTGMMISGSSVEVGSPQDEQKATSCWIETTEDSGYTWQKYGPIDKPGHRFGVIEPALFWDTNGNLHMLCRDRAHRVGEIGWVHSAKSTDGGKTWSQLEKSTLPNPDSGIDVVELGRDCILVVYNHSHTERYPLNVALSQDAGRTWTMVCTLEEKSGEFPAAIMTSDGLVHVMYAWSEPGKTQRRIKHAVLEID